MKKVLAVLLPLTILCAACVPAGYRRGAYPGPHVRTHPYPYGYGRTEVPSSSVVGRWDNVMLLPAGTPVQVLMMDGRKAGGEVMSADATTLRMLAVSGQVDLAAAEVMRVDRLPLSQSREYREAASRGAAWGAGAVGLIGLLVGHMPPARMFAAGAIMGAAQSAENLSLVRGPVMIYLAPPRQKPETP